MDVGLWTKSMDGRMDQAASKWTDGRPYEVAAYVVEFAAAFLGEFSLRWMSH
jgi:hypothetical protein